MLAEAFYWLVNMSLAGTIAGLLVVLIGKIRRIPRRIVCAMWVIPFIRLCVPIGVNSRFSLMSLLRLDVPRTVDVSDGRFELSFTNYVMGAEEYFPIVYKTEILSSIFTVGAVVWLIVCAALIAVVTAVYLDTYRLLKGAVHVCCNVYTSDKVSTPAVYGVFRARIVLAKECGDDEMKYILMHENAHIRRLDNLRRVIAAVTACVHWFNPLSWLLLKCYFSDLELACDEMVMSSCGEEERKKYALSLLDTARSTGLVGSAFGGAKLKVRIERILSYKRLSVFSAAAFFALAAAVGYVLLTNSK